MVLVANKEKFEPCPDNIAVIGGGRWARVLTEVLCGLVPSTVGISVHSPHNANAMSAWTFARGLDQRIHVSPALPDIPSGTSNAVIVVNAARDHEKSIEWAISKGIPVLVEKPITLNYVASQRLANLARSQKTYFASAHVFLFAKYIQNFSRLVTDGNSIQSIRVHWMDPQSESRYGEAKNYDPGLSVFADCLPHVISIVGTLTNIQTDRCDRLEFLRGGAHLEIDLMLGDIPCSIQLVRNGNCRQRIIEVTTQQKMVKLDFSSEPGTITSGSTTRCGDPDWGVKAKPVTRMLGAFLQGAAGGMRDNRLDIKIGLRASQIIDQVSSLYYPALFSWLSKKLIIAQDCDNSDLCYTLSEIIHAEDPHSSIPIDQRIDYVYRYISESAMPSLNADIIHDNVVEIIRMALRQGKPLSANVSETRSL